MADATHRRRRFDPRTLILVILVAGALLLTTHALLRRDDTPADLRATATGYLDAVVAGDTTAAWDLACSAEHGRGPRSSWSPVAARPLAAYVITAVDTLNDNRKTPATHLVTAAVTYRGAPEDTPPTVRRIEIIKESGVWKACPQTPL
ncbi:hypothetical protein ACIA8K_24575 [Catenuloplanes sp. NPDC051500]|uniref:Rv0361 family membrane protein n=1 Tax=Catenuloplanes sp. NPDC051500 TaxID=3363959 RepID=UPI0037BD10BF